MRCRGQKSARPSSQKWRSTIQRNRRAKHRSKHRVPRPKAAEQFPHEGLLRQSFRAPVDCEVRRRHGKAWLLLPCRSRRPQVSPKGTFGPLAIGLAAPMDISGSRVLGSSRRPSACYGHLVIGAGGMASTYGTQQFSQRYDHQRLREDCHRRSRCNTGQLQWR
jgi:hypothetical protein